MAQMKSNEIKTASSSEILKAAKDSKGIKQADLAARLGMAQPSLSGNMNRTRIGLDVFARMLDAMGYDVIVKDRDSGKDLWKVEV